VGAAAAFLFGKLPHGLSTAESAVLAALLQNPNAGAESVRRRAALLAVEADGAAIADAAARLDAPAGRSRVGLAPHLAHRLLPGATTAVATTLDADVQRAAREALARALTALYERRVEDGAVLVADNATGDVLAYVGGSGTRSRARFVDTVRARRQPGSTLKPFLYALAFDRRTLTPASLVEDTPLAIAVAGGLYRPRDYDEQFRGLVSARTALASSLNVPAVRTLALIGVDAFAETLRALGFAGVTESGDWYGPALALGGADVTLEELVAGYRALANGGVWTPLRLVPDGGAPPAAHRVFSPAAAFQVTDVLADRDGRSTTFGLESALATRFFTAVKTGTSKEMRDNWCVGFSERYTVGVWVGNASGAPMHDVSGVSGAAPVWFDVMNVLHRTMPSRAPAPPPSVTAAVAEFPNAVEAERREWFVAGTEPGPRTLATGDPRITAPLAGTIVALDPDIPAGRQRVALEASGAVPGLRWRLDGVDLGPAIGLTLWEPRPGTHTLRLMDAAANERDAATFEVRGVSFAGIR
jgi:penicillin-binding protein 1C